ncbi:hypothetical protein KUTeg_011448 [Tegillarca granosa]|uniref:Uncharacterized protein n=1 Tax=Tegillarca granosa TaxID=220873 RepID=A0ABQ9F0R9_TEGGR|nr:hypothetical protein KUTeg_011448 [Tegillarca granosa]
MTRGIAITDTGNVLVVLYEYKDGMIVEITTNGKHFRTIQQDIVDNIICTNINGDKSKVVVVNKQGQRRFIYQAEGRKLKSVFKPQYVVTDKHGHIIISDFYNSVINVLDIDGKFIQFLTTPEQGCDRPVGFDLVNRANIDLVYSVLQIHSQPLRINISPKEAIYITGITTDNSIKILQLTMDGIEELLYTKPN